MLNRAIGVAATVLLLLRAGMATGAESFIDRTVGGLTVGEARIEDAVRVYGKGLRRKHFHGETLCYYSQPEGVYIHISSTDGIIYTIALSTTAHNGDKVCRKSVTTARMLTTGKGVRLGDAPTKVIDIYGPPHNRKPNKNGVTFEYYTDYTKSKGVKMFYQATFTFVGERLVRVAIHDGE